MKKFESYEKLAEKQVESICKLQGITQPSSRSRKRIIGQVIMQMVNTDADEEEAEWPERKALLDKAWIKYLA